MNPVIKALIVKDWYFCKKPILGFTLIGLISISLLTIESTAAFYAGLVLLLSIAVVLGALLIYWTVVNERKDKTLAFVMSLPITPIDYAKAKLAFNLLSYSLVWILLVIGVLGVISFNDHLPNGLIPVSILILVELMIAYILVLGVSIVTESESWTTVIITITNIFVSLFMLYVGSLEGINEYLGGAQAVWNSKAITILSLEITVAILIIVTIFYLQSKKKTFI